MDNQKLSFLILFSLFCFTIQAQITFEPGYYITNQGQKVNGLVRNADWSNNPTSFEFKANASAEDQIKDISDVQEFRVNEVSKYIRVSVEMDRSPNDIANMSRDRNPVYSRETLFLKTLVEGSATLYKYKDGQLIRFFFKTKDSEISQLVYKKYLFSDRQTTDNNYYQQQLYNEVNCSKQNVTQLSRLDYTTKNLVNYFILQNQCLESAYTNYEANGTRTDFNLYLKAGLNFTDLEVVNSISESRGTDFGSGIHPRFGIEAEVILPFNKGKWSLFTEPFFELYRAENFREGNSGPGSSYINSIDYKSISLPLGVRYYAFLNEKLATFFNLGAQWHFDNKEQIIFGRGNGFQNPLDIRAGQTLFLGAGIIYNKRYVLELRYNTPRDLTALSNTTSSKLKIITFTLGYKLF